MNLAPAHASGQGRRGCSLVNFLGSAAVTTLDPPPLRRTLVRHDLDQNEALAVTALVQRARAVDGSSALNEQALLHLRSATGQVRHVLAYDGEPGTGTLVGYAHLDLSEARAGVAAETVVDPDHRRSGWAAAVVSRALAESDGAPVLLWSHGDHPGAARLAERLGFHRVRDLWQLRRRLGPHAPPLPDVALPPGVQVRTFVPGQDEAAWLDLNARAFTAHPEQGAMTADDLAQRTGSDWFDPAGFFLAERSGPNGPRLVGFHWTKVHAAAEPGGHAAGEVYVVGVEPDEQGSGLGSALTLIGVHHLAGRGLDEVLLYVEADNAAALRVYERLGFAHVGTDTQYRHPGRRES